MSEAAADIFDHCPNRITYAESGRMRVECPKYRAGTDFTNVADFNSFDARGKAAIRLGCLGCRFSSEEYDPDKETSLIDRLHEEVVEHAGGRFLSEYYSDAVTAGYLTVRDRLRDLTGHETASEAFGKGGLYVNGSAAEHVDDNFQEGAKFLMMAIDRFRNERSHTRFGNDHLTGSQKAYEFLVLSSLAMHLLDSAEVKVQE